MHNTELHVRTPRPNFYIVWDTTQIVCGSFKAGANLSGRGEQTKNFWKRQQTRENKNTQKKAHADDAFKVVKKQEAAASFALPQQGLRRLNMIACKNFFFFLAFFKWALPHCECNPECVCLPVCLPVCLSAAEGVPTGSDSLLLAVLEAELW